MAKAKQDLEDEDDDEVDETIRNTLINKYAGKL